MEPTCSLSKPGASFWVSSATGFQKGIGKAVQRMIDILLYLEQDRNGDKIELVTACSAGVGSEGREQCWGAGEVHLKSMQPQPLHTPPSAPLVPDWEGAELLHGGGGVPLSRTPTLWKGNVLSLGANIFSPCDPPTRPRLFSSGQCGPGIRRRSKRALAGAAPLAQQCAAQRAAFFFF